MAETQTKRHLEHDTVSETEPTKRHRTSYNINDQQETTQDLLDFLTNLSSDPFLVFAPQPEPDPDTNLSINNDEDKERVIRHLLEASDDELGIPSRVDDGGGGGVGGGDDEVAGGEFPVDLCDGLWEIEDEAANYYTLLQSELFMQ